MIWYLLAGAVALAAVALVVVVGLGTYGQVKRLKGLVASRSPAIDAAGAELTQALEQVQRRQSASARARSADAEQLPSRVRRELGR